MALGVLVVGGIVTAYLLLRSGSSTVERASKLPKGLTYVGAFDLEQLLKAEKIKKLLEAPPVATVLETASKSWGVDILALESVYGGAQVIDGQLHMLTVIAGKFRAERLNPSIDKIYPGAETIEIDGRKLYRMPDLFGQLMAARPPPEAFDSDGDGTGKDDAKAKDDGKAKDGKRVAPAPMLVAPMAFGVVDKETFVFGSITLIERFLDDDGETVGDDEKMAGLIGQIDEDAFAWGVGVLDGASLGQLAGLNRIPTFNRVADKLNGTEVKMEGFLSSSGFNIRMAATFPTDEAAEAADLVRAAGERMFAAQAKDEGLGFDIPKPEFERDGRTLKVTMDIPFPEVPSF